MTHFDIRRMPGAVTLAITCFVILYIPMVILLANSFNAGKVIGQWEGLSPHWYARALQNEAFLAAAKNSLILASVAAVVATVLATMAALATTRGSGFRGEGVIHIVLNQPLMVPEIVLAIALLIILAQVKQITGYTGLGYLIAAHTTFCIPFAYMPIRARLQGMNPALLEAAADLYAPPWKVFWKVSFPLLMPGILAGAMMAFIISMDDFVITYFVAGAGSTTLPIYIFSSIRMGISPKINAISTIMLFISIAFVALSYYIGQRKR